ncbi:MAG: hypothetical protein U9M90_03925 [Patescibacteria group bacterium]|nr:hypothetical protein [Patescibacteria group bacterium]
MKKRFLVTIWLLALIIGASFLFAQTTYALAGGITVPANTGLPDPADPPGYAGAGPVIAVIFNFLGWILAVFILLAVISFVITGIQYFMAMGDQYKAETAKRNFTYSIIAVAVAGAGLILIRTIDYLLS